MNVLSLFDGMSCGHIALDRAGVRVDKYYASEIKPHAIKVTQHNYPDTIQLGDITKIDFTTLDKIDLLMGGSPCQDFSRANKSRLGLRGDKSSLFYYYLKALDVCKPKYFLLENVIMEKKQAEVISNELGVYPVRINSSLVSAQLRDRLYWTNIPGDDLTDFLGRSIAQPKDKKLKLNDVLMYGWKSEREKALCIMSHEAKNMNKYGEASVSKRYIAKRMGKSFCAWLTKDGEYRPYNKIERCRLQTVPDNYCECIDEKQAADILGDGWTIDVIAHIFKGLING